MAGRFQSPPVRPRRKFARPIPVGSDPQGEPCISAALNASGATGYCLTANSVVEFDTSVHSTHCPARAAWAGHLLRVGDLGPGGECLARPGDPTEA
jgi:hypothetical protein